MFRTIRACRRNLPPTLASLVVLFALVACATTTSTPTPTPPDRPSSSPTTTVPSATATTAATATPTEVLPTPNLPTATPFSTPVAQAGRYSNPELGISFAYPWTWEAVPGDDGTTLVYLFNPSETVVIAVFQAALSEDTSLMEVAETFREATAQGADDVVETSESTVTLDDGRDAVVHEYDAAYDAETVRVRLVTTVHEQRAFAVVAFGAPDDMEAGRGSVSSIVESLSFSAPQVGGIPRDEALFYTGGESSNPRVYDPATGRGVPYVFSGLVVFTPDLEVVPDLAERWEVSEDGTAYTFYLHEEARFHDGRPVTAADVVYSWERAADPETDSDTVLTYLGDIVGVQERHAGDADHIRGLEIVNEHTLRVTIDAPKPYFLAKLTQPVAHVVDRANVESGPEWYRTPNGTGPYRLSRWDSFEQRLFERNEDFYLEPPSVRFIVEQLYAGSGIRLYETGQIDVTGVSTYEVERLRDPTEPLHADLREQASMCTRMVGFDTTRPPFDDADVREAFALAVDRERYVEVVMRGVGVPAHGL